MNCIRVGTLNVRGLNDSTKRRTILNWLKEKNIDIICLQETFLKDETKHLLLDEWEGKVILNTSNSSHSRGCAILFKKHFDYEVMNSFCDNDGRQILLNIKHANQIYTIVCLYAPNNESHRKAFFNHTVKWIHQNALNLKNPCVCGDLNCALEPIDRLGSSNNKSSAVNLKTLLLKLSLVDVFRKKWPSKKEYTYYNKSRTIQSRIDYILGSEYMFSRVNKIYTLHAPRVPDHKLLVCHLQSDVQIGSGYWKLNVSLLQNDDLGRLY